MSKLQEIVFYSFQQGTTQGYAEQLNHRPTAAVMPVLSGKRATFTALQHCVGGGKLLLSLSLQSAAEHESE